MEEKKEIKNNKSRKTVNFLLSLVFIILILIIVSATLFIYFRIIPTDFFIKSTEPTLVQKNTLSKMTITEKSQKTFDQFYTEVNEISKETQDIDLGIFNANYDSSFNIKPKYYNHCKSKKVEINFSKSKFSNFTFNYLNQTFNYNIQLYQDLYRFTDNLKGEDCYFRKDKYVLGFLEDPYNQQFMEKVEQDFLSLQDYYTSDEIVEIATVFVQSIKYETDKTQQNRYPYETLYEEKGNCLDKSVILAEILSHLGYSTFIVLGDSVEYHSVVGIACEKGNLLLDNKKICLIETTKFAPIGEEVNITNIKIVNISSGPKIYKGKNYGPDLAQYILLSKEKAGLVEKEINSSVLEFSNIQKKMCMTDCVRCKNNEVDFEKSNNEITHCKDAEEYNYLVKDFNQEIENYNNKILKWYQIYYDVEERMFENVHIVKRG